INEKRSTPIKYLSAELLWYLSGTNDSKFITKYSKFWNKILNLDNTINSAYGYLLFNNKNKYDLTQWDWAKQSLIKDKYSRQAIIHFNNENHQYDSNKDFVCTMYGIFNIRDNKLNLTITQRSCDVIKGLTFDLPFFTVLLQLMYVELKDIYENLEIGYFYHFINSLHLYENDFNLVKEMITHVFYNDKLPIINNNIIKHIDIINYIDNNIVNSNDSFIKYLFNNLE
ncbi:MAG TPA: thymidylate synthase, partial [Bacteroidales bacterium]|nr:thymidylate synthase [Bacteroidales bacterium]